VIGPPAAPGNVQVAQSGATALVVSWMDNSTTPINESTFTVERSLNGGAFTAVTTRPSHAGTGTVTWTNTFTFTAGQTYAYRVRANNSMGSSAFAVSNPLTIP
jgi:hypothetical protein